MKASQRRADAAGAVNPPSSRGQVLIVEDEQDLQELLRYNLAREGFTVTCAERGDQALNMIRANKPDLILLDLMLPGMDGLTLCRTLRAEESTAKTPVIMMTAKGEEADVVVGLELGADDYIIKPFSTRVLVARVNAALRRGRGEPAETASTGDGAVRLQLRDLLIDRERFEIRVGNLPVPVTAMEFKLLSLLVSKPGRVFTRAQIIAAVHDGLAAVTDRSVDVQVAALRRKLGSRGKDIQTVRGVGYRFQE